MAVAQETLQHLRSAGLAEVDPEIAELLTRELERQRGQIELIASENFTWPSILEAMGSVPTNKYAEGYPEKRYYGGCEVVDEIEAAAIERAKSLFGAEHANVQPHAGAQANMGVYFAALQPGDTILSMRLDHGGHLSHGLKVNFSGRLYTIVGYGVDRETNLIDFDEVRQLAMEHFAGLVAAGLHPNPTPYCDFVTSTTHKTLAGPRAGFILCKEEYAKDVDRAVFPGMQGGPLEHVIAAKAACFRIAATEAFRDYQQQVRANADALGETLMEGGLDLLTGGTDTHLLQIDLRNSEWTGKDAEERLHDVKITVNRNTVPFDERPPTVGSGVRVGTPAATMRGFDEQDFREVGQVMVRALDEEPDLHVLRARVDAICERRTLYPSFRGYTTYVAE